MFVPFAKTIVGLMLGAGLSQVPSNGEAPPSGVEQAIIDYECTDIRVSADSDAQYEACLATRLALLRRDFGQDLSRLSASDRRTIDSFCRSVGANRGRDARVKCLSNELGALRIRRGANQEPATPDVQPSTPDPSHGDAVPATPLESPDSRRTWIGASVLTAAFVAGVLTFVATRRRAPRKCRSCGGVAEAGDLCGQCRRQTADAIRRSAADRLEEERRAEEEQRLIDAGEQQRRREALQRGQDEFARLQELESQARQSEQRRLEEDERHLEALERRRVQEPYAAPTPLSDPYAILEVSRDAGSEEITAAYEKAKSSFDPRQMTHLSEEVQSLVRRKAEAVEQAFQTITSARTVTIHRAESASDQPPID